MKNYAVGAIPMRARATYSNNVRPVAADMRPIVWSIAGSDSGAGAGLQADLKALQAFGVHGCTAVAAITAQNSMACTHVEPVSAELLNVQLSALALDMPPNAIKTGLLGSVDNVHVVCQWVDRLRAQGMSFALVVDPVLGSSTGAAFADHAVRRAYVTELFPRATLITPNQAEAQRLGLAEPASQHDLLQQGVSVCITGGDADESHANDWFNSPKASGWLSLPRVNTRNCHGTGCTFAATAAAALASGYCVADAVVLAKMASTHALGHAYGVGHGAGPIQALPNFAQHADNLPVVTLQGAKAPVALHALQHFARLSNPGLGIYAVVDSAAWVHRVLQSGIRTVQLRIKDPADPALASQIAQSIAIANATPGTQLFINDHWQLALRHGAYGVHLGQGDLDSADLDSLRRAGVRLGLSTHSYWEVARAWALRPSYIACGPIFATQSKDMHWIPQGLDNLRYWVNVLPLPVVGIAGIDAGNVAEIAATGAASAAVISAITKAEDPERACRILIEGFSSIRRGTHIVADITAASNEQAAGVALSGEAVTGMGQVR